MKKKIFLSLPLFFAVILNLSACSISMKNSKKENPVISIIMKEPIYINLTRKGIITIYDSETLFKKAEEALDDDNYNLGLSYYLLLLKEFPHSRFVPLTIYNIGAIFEDKKEDIKALKFYKYLVKNFSRHPLVPRAMFRIAIIEERNGLYRDALKAVEKLSSFSLKEEENLKVMVIKGVLLTEIGEIKKGLNLLEKADLSYSTLEQRHKEFDRYFWGWDRFAIAETVFSNFRDYHITGKSKSELKDQLTYKAELLLKAMRKYFLTLHTRSLHWATAAVYRIGLLYELFYLDLVRIKPPDTLTNEEKEVYYEELEKVLKPVKEKAIETYQKIINYSQLWGVDTLWVKKAKEHLEILKSFTLFNLKG